MLSITGMHGIKLRLVPLPVYQASSDIQQKGTLTTLVSGSITKHYKYFIWEFLSQLTLKAMLSQSFFPSFHLLLIQLNTCMNNFLLEFLISTIPLPSFLNTRMFSIHRLFFTLSTACAPKLNIN